MGLLCVTNKLFLPQSKIIRVLNLWQKNMVFAPETIQPLFDLANPEHPIHLQYNASLAAGGGGADQSGTGSNGAGGLNTSAMSHDSPGPMSHDDHHSSGGGGGGGGVGGSQSADPSKVLDQNTIRQLQQFQQILMRQTSGSASEAAKNQVKFDKKLLAADFDYGSEDEEDKNSPSVPSTTLLPDGGNIAAILSDPNVLKQLQQLQNLQKLKQHEMEEKQSKLTEMRLQEEKFEKHLASVLKVPTNNSTFAAITSSSSISNLTTAHQQLMKNVSTVCVTAVCTNMLFPLFFLFLLPKPEPNRQIVVRHTRSQQPLLYLSTDRNCPSPTSAT